MRKGGVLVQSATADPWAVAVLEDQSFSNVDVSVRVKPVKAGEWHALRVVAKGTKILAYIGDKLLIDQEDATFKEGYVGLWTKADSVTEFDDFEASGTPAT